MISSSKVNFLTHFQSWNYWTWSTSWWKTLLLVLLLYPRTPKIDFFWFFFLVYLFYWVVSVHYWIWLNFWIKVLKILVNCIWSEMTHKMLHFSYQNIFVKPRFEIFIFVGILLQLCSIQKTSHPVTKPKNIIVYRWNAHFLYQAWLIASNP